MDIRRAFGNAGEQMAERYLKQKGYRILHRQFRTRYGEIDLIALDGDEIVFVEVKARSSNVFGFPEESVTQEKLRKIFLVANQYMNDVTEYASFRIDVVAILQTKNETQVMHLEAVGGGA